MKSPKELLQTMLSKIGDGTSFATVEILKELVTIQLDEAGTLSMRIGDDKKTGHISNESEWSIG